MIRFLACAALAAALFALPARAQTVGADCRAAHGQQAVDLCSAALDANRGLDDAARADLVMRRGMGYFDLRRLDMALADFNTVVALRPDYWGGYLERGLTYGQLLRNDEAMRDFSTAIAKDPTVSMSWNNRCYGRAVLNRELAGALADCDKAIAMQPDPGYYDSRALVNLRLGRWQAAAADCDAALAQQPRKASSLYMRGLARLKTGDAAGGIADLDAASALDPGLPRYYAGMGVGP